MMTVSRLAIASRPNEHGIDDIYLDDDGDLAFVTDAEAVGQHVKNRVKTFEGEWFLDTTAGVPWLDEIMGKRENLPLAEALMKAEILDTDGVTGLAGFSASFNRARRSVDVTRAVVATEYDEEVGI